MEKYIFFERKNLLVQVFYLILLICMGIIIFSFFGLLITKTIYHLDWNQILNHVSAGRLYQTICTVGFFLFPALSFSFLAKGNSFTYSLADKNISLRTFTVVIVLSFMIIPVVSYIAHLNQMIKFPDSLRTIENWLKLNEEATETLFKSWTANMTCQNLFINILVLALIPGVCEEFLFRGTIQPFLNKVFKNIHVAILVSAFLFSIIHFQFNGFIPRFLLGIYLGYLVLWSGSLWTSVAAHFLHNACSLLLDFGLKKNGINMDNYTPNDIPGFYGLLIVSIIFLGTGIWILWYGASIMPKTTISTNNNITENEI